MKVYSAADVVAALPYDRLVEGLREVFREGAEVPLRHKHHIENPSGSDAIFALMPAWQSGDSVAVKLLTIFPDNADTEIPTINASIILFNGESGVPTAVVDGNEVTRRRTGAASALAATYLAREDSARLLVLGTGPQALHNALAHGSVRPILKVEVWGRSPEKANAMAGEIAARGDFTSVRAVTDLKQAVRSADIVTTATSSAEPLIMGEWLSAGAHLDMVGSHTSTTRECDDEAVRRARVWIDTRAGAMVEAGEILIPIDRGVITADHVIGDLQDLVCGAVAGRESEGEITLFKSVGSGIEDLAAAKMVAGA